MHRTHRLPSWLTVTGATVVAVAAVAVVSVVVPAPPVAALAGQATLTAPAGSVSFGSQLVTLPNGNILVADSDWTTGGHSGLGAVHLFDGRTHTLISSITGSHDFDAIGAGSITVLPNSNYLIGAPDWDNGATVDAGAVVFGTADGSVSGVVGPSNSLVGSTANDGVGSVAPIVLTNGNYVVGTSGWDNGPADVGAATWGSGATGVVGPISSTNSLIGSRANSAVGSDVVALTNGNYVASTETWGSGGLDDLGAVTLGNGLTGTVGFVTSANSLVGGRSG